MKLFSKKDSLRILGMMLVVGLAQACLNEYSDTYNLEADENLYTVLLEGDDILGGIGVTDLGVIKCYGNLGTTQQNCSVTGDTERVIGNQIFNVTYQVRIKQLYNNGVKEYAGIEYVGAKTRNLQELGIGFLIVRDDVKAVHSKIRVKTIVNGSVINDSYGYDEDSNERNFTLNIYSDGNKVYFSHKPESGSWIQMGAGVNIIRTGQFLPKFGTWKSETGGPYGIHYIKVESLDVESEYALRATYQITDLNSGSGINNTYVSFTNCDNCFAFDTGGFTNKDGFIQVSSENNSIKTIYVYPVCSENPYSFLYAAVTLPDGTNFNTLDMLDDTTDITEITHAYPFYGLTSNISSLLCVHAYDTRGIDISNMLVEFHGNNTVFMCITNTTGECCQQVLKSYYRISAQKSPEYPYKEFETAYPVFTDINYQMIYPYHFTNINLMTQVDYINASGAESPYIKYIYCPNREGDYIDFFKNNPYSCNILTQGSANTTGYYEADIEGLNDYMLIIAQKTGYQDTIKKQYVSENGSFYVTMILDKYAIYNYSIRFTDCISDIPISNSVNYVVEDSYGNHIKSGVTLNDECISISYNLSTMNAEITAIHENYSRLETGTLLTLESCKDVCMTPKTLDTAYAYNVSGYVFNEDGEGLGNLKLILECVDGTKKYNVSTSTFNYAFINVKRGISCHITHETSWLEELSYPVVLYANRENYNLSFTEKIEQTNTVNFIVYETVNDGKRFISNAKIKVEGGYSCTTNNNGACSIAKLKTGMTYEYAVTANNYDTKEGDFKVGYETITIELTSTDIKQCDIWGYIYYQDEEDNAFLPIESGQADRVLLELYDGGAFIGSYKLLGVTGYYRIAVICDKEYTLSSEYETMKDSKDIKILKSDVRYDIYFKKSAGYVQSIRDGIEDAIGDTSLIYVLIFYILPFVLLIKLFNSMGD